ncbi:hypothetical protein HPP92_009471 [Vanilla planifolia]|uniref:QLQ domain-containing protein n=1 Tax=Vanilla planifolia TaxID=51239 RepID=A0A835V8W3_VANPL|nr:hypothetical protein HPP92_009471 [Vanilla planifolia]
MSCHHLFTASQLQELEVQALMFNCFSLGLPVPSHLLVSFGRSTRRETRGFFLAILLVSPLPLFLVFVGKFDVPCLRQWVGVASSWVRGGRHRISNRGGAGGRTGRNGGVQEELALVPSTV